MLSTTSRQRYSLQGILQTMIQKVIEMHVGNYLSTAAPFFFKTLQCICKTVSTSLASYQKCRQIWFSYVCTLQLDENHTTAWSIAPKQRHFQGKLLKGADF